MRPRPFVVGGRLVAGEARLTVTNPWNGETVAELARPGRADLDAALAAAAGGFETTRRLPAWRRAAILRGTADRIAAAAENWARTITLESGKPIGAARIEVERAITTLRVSAGEAERIAGEVLPLDLMPGAEGRFGIVRRFPVGPVACITPFNFPLNLVAHKLGPALAAGCPFILKPASKTPSAALDLAAALLEAGAPEAAVSVLPLSAADAGPLVEDPRVRAVSFTGSPEVGWEIRRRAYRKKVVLELGGNAGAIVDASADLDLAARRVVAGGFSQAGQSCVSVQRVFVHETVFDDFLGRLLPRVAALVCGDPLDPATDVGPLVTLEEAVRVAKWIDTSLAGGATRLAGGDRSGSLVPPTVLTGTSPGMDVCAREIFGPVVVVERCAGIDAAVRAVDASEYGLQAGIFTRDLGAALRAFEEIEAGAVLVNDVPTWRADAMPYGGVKKSGSGREGPRWAIEDFTEPRLLVVSAPQP